MITFIFYCQHRRRLKYSPKHRGYVSVGADCGWNCAVTYRWDSKSRKLVPLAECAPVT